MNQKNLALFQKQRGSLKVIGTPSQQKLPSHMSLASGKTSILSKAKTRNAKGIAQDAAS